MSVNCNVGTMDRIVRLVVAVALVGLAAFGGLESWVTIATLVVAAILGLTAVVRFCPLYALFGIRTCPANPR